MNIQPFCQRIEDPNQLELTTFINTLKAAGNNRQKQNAAVFKYLIALNADMFIRQLYERDLGMPYVLYDTGSMEYYNFKIYGSLLPSIDKKEGYIYFLGLTEADVKDQMFKAAMQRKVESITLPIRTNPCLH